MNWNTSIFNDDRSKFDSWQNRDSDTHREMGRNDLMNPRETTNWEQDLVEQESLFFSKRDAEFNQEDTN